MKPLLALPHDPYPLAPREGEVVDGHHVLLRWEPATGADRYRAQIATGPDFRDVLFEQDVPVGATALVVRCHFPGDDSLCYWRVLAGDAEGWSEGDCVEAFTSGTTEQVRRFVVPDVTEPFGPVRVLLGGHPRSPRRGASRPPAAHRAGARGRAPRKGRGRRSAQCGSRADGGVRVRGGRLLCRSDRSLLIGIE